jgi:hypothetical protein
MAAVNSKSHASGETTLRHLWLAGLGLVAVGRREALARRARLKARADELRQAAGGFAEEAQARIRGRMGSRAGRFSADIEARLAPVLEKLGLVRKPTSSARKPRKATRTAQLRRPVRLSAKRATSKR